jgi:hypothetical protein
MSEIDLEVINYSEKSIVLRGKKTKEWTNRLKEEGGRFNPSLTDPITSNKFCGWLFKKSDQDKINKILYDMNNSCVDINRNNDLDSDIIIEDISIPSSETQKLNFEIHKPDVGQICKIYSNEILLYKGKVMKIRKEDSIVTECMIKIENKSGLFSTLTAGIVGMKWKILGTLIETNIKFE